MKKLILVFITVSILFIFCSCSNENTEKSTTMKQKSNMTDTVDEKNNDIITVKVGEKSFSAQLYDNETAKAFYDKLPLTLDMSELHGNEKYFYLESSLPTESVNIGDIKIGDIMLYGDNCIVLFYDSFSTNYSYSKIGYIENTTDLADAVGSGNITIKFDK